MIIDTNFTIGKGTFGSKCVEYIVKVKITVFNMVFNKIMIPNYAIIYENSQKRSKIRVAFVTCSNIIVFLFQLIWKTSQYVY